MKLKTAMKLKTMIVGALMAMAGSLTALFVPNGIFKIVIICLIAVVGTIILYFVLVSPIIIMKLQLEKIEKENRQLEDMRKQFVANVTHELKTPLTSIMGFIETLQDGAAEDPDTRTKFIDIIAIETARLKRLIEDTLVLSDIESKKPRISSKINLDKAVREAVLFIEPIAEQNNITILINVNKDINVFGNADRLKQMILNLVENAIKYSNPGGRVWIDGYMEYGKVVLKIKDEGIGISKDNLERLFERFYRVDKSRSRKVGGTGLGLSIVKHIAALFNAEVKVESKLGEGSSFYVIFKNID